MQMSYLQRSALADYINQNQVKTDVWGITVLSQSQFHSCWDSQLPVTNFWVLNFTRWELQQA